MLRAWTHLTTLCLLLRGKFRIFIKALICFLQKKERGTSGRGRAGWAFIMLFFFVFFSVGSSFLFRNLAWIIHESMKVSAVFMNIQAKR